LHIRNELTQLESREREAKNAAASAANRDSNKGKIYMLLFWKGVEEFPGWLRMFGEFPITNNSIR